MNNNILLDTSLDFLGFEQAFGISSKHFQEWVQGSAILPELARLNLRSVSGEDIFELLYPHPERINSGRLNSAYLHAYDNCKASSGWWIDNIDPETGEITDWGQFKADANTPLSDVKYRSPKGETSQPICLKIPRLLADKIAQKSGLELEENQEFWQWFLENDSLPLVICEGVKKAAAVLSKNIPAVALTGVDNAFVKEKGQKKLHPTLIKLCKGRPVFVLFDSDPLILTKLHVKNARQRLGMEINKEASELSMAYVPAIPGEKVGVDDFLVGGGNLLKVLRTATNFKDWMNPKKSRSIRAQLTDMRQTLDGRLKFNQLIQDAELDGKPVNWDLFPQIYARDIDDHYYGKNKFTDLAITIAHENSYHPVRNYFEKLPASNYNLDEIAVKYFGAEPGSLQCQMVRKWLISAVARIYQPGCKADSALILYDGKGGIGKSTWLKTLCADPSWFCDDMGSPQDKDQLLKMHQHWIIEWAELDCILGFKNDSAIKSAISCAADNLRPPYGRSTIKMPRGSILCGTTNKREFLVSSGGDRRYWIVECQGLINNKLLEQERDLIWAAAKAAYQSGEAWHLDYIQQHELSQILSSFKLKREGQEEIEEFLESLGERTVFLTKELRDYLDIPTNDRKFTQQARRILEELGWLNGFYSVAGEKGKGYKYLVDSGKPNGKPSKPTENLGLPLQNQSEKELEPTVNQVNLNSIEQENSKNKDLEVSNNTPQNQEKASFTPMSERFTRFTVDSKPCGCQENCGKPNESGKPKQAIESTASPNYKYQSGDQVRIVGVQPSHRIGKIGTVTRRDECLGTPQYSLLLNDGEMIHLVPEKGLQALTEKFRI